MIPQHLASPTHKGIINHHITFNVDTDSPEEIMRFYCGLVRALADPDPNVRGAAKATAKEAEAAAGINDDSGEEVTAAQEATP